MPENKKNQIIFLFITAVIFLACAGGIMLTADPFTAAKLVILLFYICISAFLFSVFSIILLLVNSRAIRREAFFLTALIDILLILSSHQLLFWWVGLLLIVTIVLIEGFFLAA